MSRRTVGGSAAVARQPPESSSMNIGLLIFAERLLASASAIACALTVGVDHPLTLAVAGLAVAMIVFSVSSAVRPRSVH